MNKRVKDVKTPKRIVPIEEDAIRRVVLRRKKKKRKKKKKKKKIEKN